MRSDLQARLREAMEGVTPGPWQVLSEEHPWTLPANPEFGRPEEKHGNHTERRVYTVAHHPQLKGPYPIIELGIGITNEPGQSVHMVSISPENSAYIALCSPDNIGSLLDHIDALSARIQELEGALERASITVKRYRRAGLGDDVFHSDLCEADKAIDKVLAARSALGRNADG